MSTCVAVKVITRYFIIYFAAYNANIKI